MTSSWLKNHENLLAIWWIEATSLVAGQNDLEIFKLEREIKENLKRISILVSLVHVFHRVYK